MGGEAEKQELLPITSNGKSLSKSTRPNLPMTRTGMIAALSYMVCAVMLVMFNKAALSTFKFPCANIVTLLQMLLSNVVLFFLRKLNVISFSNEPDNRSRDLVTIKTLKYASPLSLAYLFYMVVGMASIRGVSVPMYTALRRTTVAFTMAMEFALAGKRHPSTVVISVAIICGGALLAGLRDLTFDPYSYGMVFLSNLTTAIYLATIADRGKATGLNSFGLMWCNGILCCPVLLLWTWISGEMSAALAFPLLFNHYFLAVLTLSCLFAFALNYTIFLNTALNSPLTQSMCGNLKDLGTVAIGWALFKGLPLDILNLFGQFLGFLGSGMYAYYKIRGSLSVKNRA